MVSAIGIVGSQYALMPSAVGEAFGERYASINIGLVYMSTVLRRFSFFFFLSFFLSSFNATCIHFRWKQNRFIGRRWLPTLSADLDLTTLRNISAGKGCCKLLPSALWLVSESCTTTNDLNSTVSSKKIPWSSDDYDWMKKKKENNVNNSEMIAFERHESKLVSLWVAAHTLVALSLNNMGKSNSKSSWITVYVRRCETIVGQSINEFPYFAGYMQIQHFLLPRYRILHRLSGFILVAERSDESTQSKTVASQLWMYRQNESFEFDRSQPTSFGNAGAGDDGGRLFDGGRSRIARASSSDTSANRMS